MLIELWVYIPVTLIIATITSRTFGSTSIASNSKNEFMQKYYSYQEFPISKSVSEEFFEVPSLEDGGDYEYSEAYHATTYDFSIFLLNFFIVLNIYFVFLMFF